jgi:hypothetical protein
VEEVEVYVWDVARVAGAEPDGAGVVLRVHLEDVPGEHVSGAEGFGVAGEETGEVYGPAEEEEVFVAVADSRFLEDADGEAVRGVGAAVAGLPLDEGGVAGETEGAFRKDGEGGGGLGDDGDLVVVLEVCADAGEVDEEWDVVFLELGGGADAGELEELGVLKAPAERITSRVARARRGMPRLWGVCFGSAA